jgi:hypothetical protein
MIKCFIIHFNRPTFLARQLDVLMQNKDLDLIVVDNGSAYTPVVPKGVELLLMNKNYGHTVVWDSGMSKMVAPNERYIVTDCDVMPPNCDYLKLLNEGLDKYSHINKIGLELNISRIPKAYHKRVEVVNHEKKVLYRKEIKDKNFVECGVDTTFALYREGYHNYSVWGTDTNEWQGKCLSLRTKKIEADHLGWHVIKPYNEETQFYFNSIRGLPIGQWKD